MTDQNQTPAADSPESRKVAEHGYVDADGNEVDTIDQATGISYTHVRDGWDFTWQVPSATPGDPTTLIAIFGAKTLATNTTSSARQRGEDEHQALVDRFDNVDKGVWRERAEGATRGPKYDKDVLAQVLIAQFAADGQQAKGDVAHYRQRLNDRSYYAQVRANVKVMAAYMAEMAKRGAATAGTGSLV